jgi:hypothetical protein
VTKEQDGAASAEENPPSRALVLEMVNGVKIMENMSYGSEHDINPR